LPSLSNASVALSCATPTPLSYGPESGCAS
jgi:hypothetical protein